MKHLLDMQDDLSLIDFQITKYRIKGLTEYIDAYTENYLTRGTSETTENYIVWN